MAAPKKGSDVVGEVEVKRLSLTLPTDGELQEGEWIKLPCGFEALLAPQNTQEFYRVMQAQIRRFGGRNASSLGDVKAARQLECLCNITARANFKGFRDPRSGADEIEINGEILKDSIEARAKMLSEFPTIREEVAQEVAALSEDFDEETEEAAKN